MSDLIHHNEFLLSCTIELFLIMWSVILQVNIIYFKMRRLPIWRNIWKPLFSLKLFFLLWCKNVFIIARLLVLWYIHRTKTSENCVSSTFDTALLQPFFFYSYLTCLSVLTNCIIRCYSRLDRGNGFEVVVRSNKKYLIRRWSFFVSLRFSKNTSKVDFSAEMVSLWVN